MQPADDIRELFKDAQLGIRPEPDEQVFKEMLQAQKNAQKDPAGAPERWRIVMKSPLSKLAVAAAIAVACVAALFMWTGTQSNVALANVLTRMEQISVYMYQMSMAVTGQKIGDKVVDTNVEATLAMSRDHGMKMSMERIDPNGAQTVMQEMYMSPQNRTAISIMPSQKKYARMEFDETLFERTRKQNNDPRVMVQQILDCSYTSLGRSTVDGVEVEGFQTTDPSFMGGVMGQVDAKIWVDIKTQLPVRSEIDMQMDQMHMHAVMHDFQWDVSADAALFEPVIPDDYTSLAGGPLKMPAMNEETAIQGLRLFAELRGRYPEKLDLMSLLSQIRDIEKGDSPAAKQLREENEDLTQEERVKKFVDIMMPIQGIGTFYMLLGQDKKDPVYYGNVVTPQDADKVLLRWKVSDNEYRVIFGDLHAETVSPEKLAEFEKALPK
jgi:outer membrane lipoprotein-sorting protein